MAANLICSMAPCVAFPPSQFLNFASHSSSLSTLSLLVRVSDNDLLRCLTSLSSLRRLWLNDIRPLVEIRGYVVIADHPLHGLTPATGSRQLIPALRSLELTSHLRFCDESLMDFAASRGSAVRIRLHSLPNARLIHKTVVAWLHGCGVAVL
jgi:hypothetical protein